MKKQLFLALSIFCSFFVFAQQKPVEKKVTALEFEKEIHDFGTVSELKETIVCEFSFQNITDKSLVITAVEPACDCTIPNYSKDTVISKQKGSIEIAYDRYNNAGAFVKEIIVKGLLEDSTKFEQTIKIKGFVTSKSLLEVNRYKRKVGDFWVRSHNVMMGNVLSNEVKEKKIRFYNGGDSSLSLRFDTTNIPNHLLLETDPLVVEPKTFGTITLKYDAVKKADVGYLLDTFSVFTNEDTLAEKQFIVRTSIQQVASDIGAKISIPITTHDLGYIQKEGTKTGFFKIKNTGTSTLKIHKVHSFCECITILENKTCEIAPNETKQIKYTLSVDGYASGRKVKKSIVVYSNDSVSPERKLKVKALVK